ncbi:filamentous hemagglutinin N-terminal domain-containing protein [Plectonema radiosum NIES-515]|uniref:Filamentous hemagglutinin N-terminal domain-containing protein n=1 Tax=Plectonema radiosum NIES-515 TaxID=2986073 RepID=A0ABT3B3E4_9CYAN|nr:filamentous hemagglutinin N-terminal domain-containing protein [Plectonema radiosum]MCV3215755.1 filamentous hemagglutinin N-terminal domain-containing protein [Plectonema radiosum NIES-515]
MNKQLYLCLVTLASMVCTPALGQITPDSSLGTTVTTSELINGVLSDRINGGTIRGNNLFHSFSEFNINTGRGAYFTNPDGVSNIFSRVTGTNPSNINGTLGVLGNANLFLMNPNGLLFGTGAQLDLKGSFLGTTANSINFDDNSVFSTSPNSPAGGVTPLLSMSIPVGLGFGSNPGAIQVQGIGHNLIIQDPTFSPYLPGGSTTRLQVQPGKTLALVGGDVNLNGASLTAAGGRIELGSVGAVGQVGLNATQGGFKLDYGKVPTTANIQLRQRSLVDVSGVTAGSIQVQSNRISLSDGSVIWSQNRGIQAGGDINIGAGDLLELSGVTTDERLRSSIVSETVGLGASGNIAISTNRLILENGAAITSRTYTPAPSGNIKVNATDFIQMQGVSPKTGLSNLLGSTTYYYPREPKDLPASTAKAGDVTITTRQLSVRDGSYLLALAFGDGDGGNISIDADTIEARGSTPTTAALILASSIVSVGSRWGNSGNVTLNTRTLNLQDGGTVSTSSLGTGNAGTVTINATESVELTGKALGVDLVSNISSTVGSSSSLVRTLATYSAIGDSGNVTISTRELKVGNSAAVSVQNFGTGNAGTLRINAKSVQLDQQSGIAATTASGEGGNIFLQADNLQLRHNSGILTNAGGTGNGGNINVDVGAISQLENSNITANAVQGKGGNIQITTQGIFADSGSKITASSQLGINGQVKITTPDVKQDNALQEQATNFVNTDAVVATSCLASRNATQGKFVVTGNGGLPENPNNDLLSLYSVVPVQATNPRANSREQPAITSWKLGNPITEATQLVATTDGRLILTINNSEVIPRSQQQICF